MEDIKAIFELNNSCHTNLFRRYYSRLPQQSTSQASIFLHKMVHCTGSRSVCSLMKIHKVHASLEDAGGLILHMIALDFLSSPV